MRVPNILIVLWTVIGVAAISASSSIAGNEYTADENASWAIQDTKLSTRLGGEKQKLYEEFIQQCNIASLQEENIVEKSTNTGIQGEPEVNVVNSQQPCTDADEVRIERNIRQPSNVYNYTKVGFHKVKAPPDLMSLIQSFYQKSKHLAIKEWPKNDANIYQNTWEVPSTLVRLEDPSLPGGGSALTSQIANFARNALEEWTGQTHLRSTSVYGVREYHRGSILAPHVDRVPLVLSAILNVDQRNMDKGWPLEVYDHDGKAVNITMEVGDMVLYESHSIIHGRPFPLEGDLYSNVFIHFEPGGEEKSILEAPSYIIPGSDLEKEWLEEHHSSIAREATQKGDYEVLRRLAEINPEILTTAVDDNGWRLIHEAARSGNLETIKLLLNNGADVNHMTHHGERPLDLAISYHGQVSEMTRFLLEKN